MSDPSPEPAFAVPEHLSRFSIDKQTFLGRHGRYHLLAVGALVFDRDRLLVVQRSASERAFPNCWEVPGGSVDAEDETVLHAVARELREETGLDAVAIVDEIGSGVEFGEGGGLGRRRWLKLAFEVTVASADRIQLAPAEHQKELWVSEEQVMGGEADGVRLEFVSEAQQEMMLQGFGSRRRRQVEGGSGT